MRNDWITSGLRLEAPATRLAKVSGKSDDLTRRGKLKQRMQSDKDAEAN